MAPRHTFMILTKRPERMQMASWPPLPNLYFGVTAENQETADQRIPILLKTPAAKRFVSIEPCLGPVDLTNLTHHYEVHDKPTRMGLAFDVQIDALRGCFDDGWDSGDAGAKLDWVICGGESGLGERPMHPDWPRSLREQCQAAGVPYFFKQWGEWKPWEPGDRPHVIRHVSARDGLWGDQPASVYTNPPSAKFKMRADTLPMCRVGKKAAGCLLDGREHKEFPT